MKTINNVVLNDLLPSSISEDPQVKKAAQAIDPELKNVAGSIFLGAVYANVNKLTSQQLDHLAYSFDLNTWRDSWPIERKRQVAVTVVAQKCRMGTLSAVKKVLESLGSAVSITEWWQKTPKGEPHTFDVVASLSNLEGELSGTEQEDFIRLLYEAKPVRSHFTFTVVQNCLAKVKISAQLRSAVFARCTGEQKPISISLKFRSAIRPVAYAHI